MPTNLKKILPRLALILAVLGILTALGLFLIGEIIDAGILLGIALILFAVWGYFRSGSKGGENSNRGL